MCLFCCANRCLALPLPGLAHHSLAFALFRLTVPGYAFAIRCFSTLNFAFALQCHAVAVPHQAMPLRRMACLSHRGAGHFPCSSLRHNAAPLHVMAVQFIAFAEPRRSMPLPFNAVKAMPPLIAAPRSAAVAFTRFRRRICRLRNCAIDRVRAFCRIRATL